MTIKSKFKSYEIAYAAEFFYDVLGLESKKIRIKPIKKLNIVGLTQEEKESIENGEWVIDGWVQPASIRGLEYTIYIEPTLRLRDKIRTLAHEMTHIKQYEQDGLDNDLDNDYVLFRGKKYPKDDDEAFYLSAPWELEAEENENVLLERFQDFMGEEI